MKRLIWPSMVIIACLASTAGKAQSAIVSTGGTIQAGNSEVSYTVGEVAREKHEVTNAIVSEGMQQPDIILDGMREPITKGTIRAYPNPARNTVTIESEDNLPFVYTVYDMSGTAVIPQSSVNSNQEQIDVSQLNSGTYIIRSVSNETTIATFNLQIIK